MSANIVASTGPRERVARFKLQSRRFAQTSQTENKMGTSDGPVLGLTKIADAGPPAQRWNVAIVSEGYRSIEMTQFAADAKKFADTLLASAPLSTACERPSTSIEWM